MYSDQYRDGYAPRIIRHLVITPRKDIDKVTPKFEKTIMFRDQRPLSVAELALIGGRLIELRPASVVSTTLHGSDFISVIVYCAEDITKLDLTVCAYSPTRSKGKHAKPMELINVRTSDYIDILPLIDATMVTVLDNLEALWP